MLHPKSRRRLRNRHSLKSEGGIVLFIALVAVALLSVQFSTSSVSSKTGSSMSGSSGRVNARIAAKHSAASAIRNVAPLPFAAITVDRTDDNAGASTCTAAPSDCSLRGSVDFANLNPGTIINVPAGTYSLNIAGGAEGFSGNNSIGDLDISGNNTSIVGAGSGVTIIQQTTVNDRVIEVNPFLDASFNTSISGVTITGGKEGTGVGGGGIISGSINNTLTLTNCVISGNTATGAGTFGGGGVSHLGGDLTVSNCTFSSNSTSASGGGIGYSAGDPIGRQPSAGTLNVSGSTFSGNSSNSAAAGGGALDLFNFNLGNSTYIVSSSSFSNNTATNGNGGAIVVESGPLTVSTSSFSGNNAGSAGGAIMSAGTASIEYSRLVNNTAPPANGPAIFAIGAVTANNNWWGSDSGPSPNDIAGPGESPTTVWLQLQFAASPNPLCTGGAASLTADIRARNAGSDLTTELNGLPTFPAQFFNGIPPLGTISAATNYINGVATATYTAGASVGSETLEVTADSQVASATIQIQANTTSEPANQEVCEGGTATFSTSTSGPGPVDYVWKQGASVITSGGRFTITSTASTSTLTITNVMAGDAGTYSVEAEGECNTATADAELSLSPNTTATDPADATVCQGATASFSTTAGGGGPFSYAWTVDGSPSGGNSPTLNVSTGALSVGDHSVSVTVTGECGTATQTATLTVQEPTATSDPSDATVCQGATANFSTTASGTGPFSYSWTVDGSPAGTDSPNLSVPTGSLTVGDHTVVVTVNGGCGSASQTATLTVQEGTSATTLVDVAVCSGGMANFSTTASGTGPFTYQWKLDGNDIGGATNSAVSIDTTALSGGDHAVSVVVTGACGSVTRNATLTVQTAPAVTLNPVSQTVTNGGNVTFTAAASGNPTPTVQWQVSTNGGASFTDIPGATSTSLTFATDPSQDGNQYRAVFTNACGTATTTAATLTTCTPTAVTASPASVADACVGGVVTFSAAATGVPAPTVQWQVSTNGGMTWSNIPGATATTLNVTVTAALNNSQYRAVFTNDCGSDTTAAATLGVDSTAPVITLNSNVISLWPPNHSYHTINLSSLVTSVSDSCGLSSAGVIITSVSSDETENGNGDGNTNNDIIIAADCKSVQLRAERRGSGNGRVYRINLRLTDTAGNVATATAKVYVPKSQNGAAAVDDGPAAGYTVNSDCP